MSSVTELFDLIQHPETATSVAADRWATESEEYPWFALGRAAAYLSAKNSGRPLKNDAVFLAALNFSSRDRLKALINGHIPEFPLPTLGIEAMPPSSAEKATVSLQAPQIESHSVVLESDFNQEERADFSEPQTYEEAIALNEPSNFRPESSKENPLEEPVSQEDFVSGTAWSFNEKEEDLIAEDNDDALHQSPINEVLDEAIPEVEHAHSIVESIEPAVEEAVSVNPNTNDKAETIKPEDEKEEIPENEKGMSLADRIMAHLQEVGENRKKYLDHMVESEDSNHLANSLLVHQSPVENSQESVNYSSAPFSQFQSELIDKFIEADPKINISIPPLGESELIDLAKGSYEIEPEMVTETLAKLFIKQGKPDKAKEVYLKLIALNPNKADYFAAQILENGL